VLFLFITNKKRSNFHQGYADAEKMAMVLALVLHFLSDYRPTAHFGSLLQKRVDFGNVWD